MKKRILFVVDVRDWAYDDQAQNWKHLLKNEYDIDIIYLSDHTTIYKSIKGFVYSDFSKEKPRSLFDCDKYDAIWFFYYRAHKDKRLMATKLDYDKIGICINNYKWKDYGVETTYEEYLSQPKVVAACNDNIIKSFRKYRNIHKVTQAINPEVFKYKRKIFIYNREKENVILGWSGNPKDPYKNFRNIRVACKDIVRFSLRKDATREELNNWYNKVDIIICASKSEGGPMMLLEAGCCGVPVITTRVGLANEIIKDGVNGIFIDSPDPEDIVKGILRIRDDKELREKLGRNLMNDVLSSWTYGKRLKEVKKCLEVITNEI